MADALERVSEEEEDTLSGRFLTFLVGKETYGIEIRFVTEIVGMQVITEMPEMPDYIKGIINLRGQIIPVMDVRLRFGKQPQEYTERTCVIVIECNRIPLGLIVDSVSEVLAIPEENIAQLPSIHAGQHNKFVKNIGKVESSVVLLIDCEKLMSAEEYKDLDPNLAGMD